MTPGNAESKARRRNRLVVVQLVMMMVLTGAVGAEVERLLGPTKHYTSVYVVCPASPQQWCGVVGGHIVSRVRRP